YQYGGNGQEGFDCSGLTCNIYREVYGQPIARNSAAIFRQNVKVKDREKLREGDLVFFKVGDTMINHVGVYLQN
ncbi:MAG: peptidoglycan endopeptidase, partial [Sphingobacteriales bacterium]